jgi:nitrogen fixation protein FixH
MGEITGRKVLLFCVGAFGIIIAVNLTLAFQAVRTFPGLEVKNSYVASQGFDAAREAQLGLGWDVSAAYDAEAGLLIMDFVGPAGLPADVDSLTALVGWATSTRDDFTPEFERDGSRFVAPAELVPGNWNIRVVAIASDGTEFRQRIPLHVGKKG